MRIMGTIRSWRRGVFLAKSKKKIENFGSKLADAGQSGHAT